MNERSSTLVRPRMPGELMHRLVAVGVDGTAANWSAVCWAVAEARRAGALLLLVACAPGDTELAVPAADEPWGGDADEVRPDLLARDMLEHVRTRIAGQIDDVSTRVVTGAPGWALVREVGEDTLLVVGKRRGHPASHAVLGSTSIAVAKRCRGPVVVVPENWSVRDHWREPLVAGVRGRGDPQVLDFAFERAQRLGVALVVVEALGLPTELLEAVAPWREAYVGVELRTVSPALAPAVSLVGLAAADTQLLVLGRRTGSGHLGGSALDPGASATKATKATTRMVLHHAPCPVAVVPSLGPTGVAGGLG